MPRCPALLGIVAAIRFDGDGGSIAALGGVVHGVIRALLGSFCPSRVIPTVG
jgi:hypothetical protein